MQFKFFAYGSFSKGQIHFPKIANFIQSEKSGFVKGHVYKLRCGYPTIIPDAGGDLIEGSLFEMDAPDSYLAILDELMHFNPQQPEKSFFNRLEVDIQVDNFSQTSAYVYSLNPKKLMSAHKKITGGDWQKDFIQAPPINLSLHDRQKQYIHKLSRSKGRDIVPIKLDLYRELMNLELIVDKGRRLALTPMGKEAAFFVEP